MADQQYPDSGVLFKEKQKKNPKGPDYTGHGEYKGEKIRIAAWIRDGKSGKFMSLKFEPLEKRAQKQREEYDWRAPASNDEDIPF